MQLKDLIMKLNEWYKPTEHLAVHIWSSDDIREAAQEMEAEISQDDINNVLDNLDNNIDSEFGITRDTLRSAIENYKGEKAMDEKLNDLVVIIIDKGIVAEAYFRRKLYAFGNM